MPSALALQPADDRMAAAPDHPDWTPDWTDAAVLAATQAIAEGP